MQYVALLRGINVGGNNRVEMTRLAAVFKQVGLQGVKTYINTGNVLFQSDQTDLTQTCDLLERAIAKEFGCEVPVLIRSLPELEQIVAALPAEWVNDQTMKCDVMFLWPSVVEGNLSQQLPIKPEIDHLLFLPGTIVWRVDRQHVSRSGLLKLIGTKLYKQMTIRNCNTVRKLVSLLQTAEQANK